MPSKLVTISARISPEDAEFISRLHVADARTPSDKLRAIIADARQRAGRDRDYAGTLQTIQDLLQPLMQKIRHAEVENQIHSEVLIRLADWIPDALAFLVSSISQPDDQPTEEQLHHLESGTAERLMRLVESVLQLAITERCACYDPEIMRTRIGGVLELSRIIMEQNRK